MIEGSTKSGFKYKIDSRVLEDWALIRLSQKYDEADRIKKAEIIPEFTNLLLGEGGFDKLEKHIRKINDGFCTISLLQEELLEIMKHEEIKN